LIKDFKENYIMAKIFKHRTDVDYFDYKDFKTLQRHAIPFVAKA